MEQCKKASVDLGTVVEKLENCIQGFTNTNQVITDSAQATLKDCDSSFQFADSVCTSMGEKAQKVAASSEDTKVHGTQVLEMVKQMRELVENTLEQANQIVQESETQKGVASEVQDSFHQVNDVSKNLMEIGR